MLLLLLLLSVGIAFVVDSVSALVAVSGMPTLILPRRIQIQTLYMTLNPKPDTTSQCRSAFVPSYGPDATPCKHKSFPYSIQPLL